MAPFLLLVPETTKGDPLIPPRLLLLILVILGGSTDLRAAYVDPSTTSTLLQILAPVFIVVSLLGGYLKRGLRRLLRIGRSSSEKSEGPES